MSENTLVAAAFAMQMLLRHCCNCSHAPAAAAMLLRGQRAVVYKADVGKYLMLPRKLDLCCSRSCADSN